MVFYRRCPSLLVVKPSRVEVEVFDTPLDYNLLLGRSWVDPMRAVVSTLFPCSYDFLTKVRVVTIDQLSFFQH
jgi:hypothetical protein